MARAKSRSEGEMEDELAQLATFANSFRKLRLIQAAFAWLISGYSRRSSSSINEHMSEMIVLESRQYSAHSRTIESAVHFRT